MAQFNNSDYYNYHWKNDIRNGIIFVTMVFILILLGAVHDIMLFYQKNITPNFINLLVYILRGLGLLLTIFLLLWFFKQRKKRASAKYAFYIFIWELSIISMCILSDITRPHTYYLSPITEMPVILSMYLIMPQYNRLYRIMPPILFSISSILICFSYKIPPQELGFGSLYMGIIFVNVVGIYFSEKNYSNEYRLFKYSNIDALTGLYNRRYLDDNLKKNWHFCAKQKNTLTVCLIDIDFFKNFNDSYGHLCGDKILRKIANVLKEKITFSNAFVARYGGEEIIIVLPSLSIKQGSLLAENIRKSIEAIYIRYQSNQKLQVTVSIGVSSIIPHTDCINPDILIKQADTALYLAKTKGRNKVIICS
ncbi:GGDEF domain-containing protein [Pectinatus sottacetonis]|uniref:GGDEF domain-containing protein n=1 Tax=Pectinatus sottacetonis TaxID=1002795 RepID=UPI0018C480A6|nr:GGDEF domain-containing protein [Pectinatus sottacetonis]